MSIAISVIVLSIVMGIFFGLFVIVDKFKESSVEQIELGREEEEIAHMQKYFINSTGASEVISLSRRLNIEGLPVVIYRGSAGTTINAGTQLQDITPGDDYFTASVGTVVQPNTSYIGNDLRPLSSPSNLEYLNLKHKYRSIPIVDTGDTALTIGVAFILLQ